MNWDRKIRSRNGKKSAHLDVKGVKTLRGQRLAYILSKKFFGGTILLEICGSGSSNKHGGVPP